MPGLLVHRARRPAGCRDELIQHSGGNRIWLEVTNGAPSADGLKYIHCQSLRWVPCAPPDSIQQAQDRTPPNNEKAKMTSARKVTSLAVMPCLQCTGSCCSQSRDVALIRINHLAELDFQNGNASNLAAGGDWHAIGVMG